MADPVTEADVPVRARFDVEALGMLQQAARQVTGRVPELRAVAVLCLWDFPSQENLPPGVIVGAEGPAINPDELARLNLVLCRFQQELVAQSHQGIVRLRAISEDLAKQILARKAALEQPA